MTEMEQKMAYDRELHKPEPMHPTYSCANCQHPCCTSKGKDPQKICGNYR